MITELKESYGTLFENELLNEIMEVGIYKELPENYKILDIGDYVKSIPLLISGAIKILREDNNGDELLLYYLEKGETCSMTMTCCLGQTKSEIRAITETDTKLILIPVQKMESWTKKYSSWRNFAFQTYNDRMNELLTALDNIVFQNMDQRLIQYLQEKVRINNSKVIKSTHKEIAYDLHSSRVVVSRLLKKLENNGSIELNRNYIKVLKI